MSEPDTLEARLRAIRIICVALVLSLVVYAGLVHVFVELLHWRGRLDGPVVGVLRGILFGLGAAVFVGALVARGRMLATDALTGLARQQGARAALDQLQTRTVVLLALMESIGVFGLVLFLVGGRLRDFYVLWTLALLGQLLVAPRRELWEEVSRAASPR